MKARGPLAQGVTIHVADGRYTLAEPLVLEPIDGGTAAAPIVYEAAAGARPVLSGGRVLTGWQPGEGGVWTTRIADVADRRWYFEQLFVDGRRAVRAGRPTVTSSICKTCGRPCSTPCRANRLARSSRFA